MPLNVIVLGPPGAGKGTQAERLAATSGIPRISTGEILREAVHAGTELGRQVAEVMSAGQLVGDELMNAIVRERLGRPDAQRGFVLDGFPRTVAQAVALEGMLRGRGPVSVLSITVPEDEIVRRLTTRRICDACGATADPGAGSSMRCARCGGALVPRSDDGEAVIRRRLQVFERETRPLVAHYRRSAAFLEVDGRGTPDEVASRIRSRLEASTAVGAAARGEGA
jgi:adenylate kinase